jgi:hypothetical protein
VGRDRLEILTTLIAGPSFDPTFRPDVIEIARQDPIYRWECVVGSCERSRSGGTDLCPKHLQQFARERERGVGKAAFLTAATGLKRHVRAEEMVCRVCPQRAGRAYRAAVVPAAFGPVATPSENERGNRGPGRLAGRAAAPSRLQILSGGGLYQPRRLAARFVLVASNPLLP